MGKKKLPHDTPPKQPTDPTPGEIHLCGETPHPGRAGEKRHRKPGNNLLQFPQPCEVITQQDLAEEYILWKDAKEATIRWQSKRDWIRQRLSNEAKVEPGPREATLESRRRVRVNGKETFYTALVIR